MSGSSVIESCKMPTSSNVSDGIVNAIKFVLTESSVTSDQIECVTIGTTHFTNAFVERKELLEVGTIRICLPAARGTPPLIDWPADLLQKIGGNTALVRGGYQFDGRLNSDLDEAGVARAARDMKALGIETFAVSGLFSQINGDMEDRAKQIILNEHPDASVTLSHLVGRGGILERENAAIMNASLACLSGSVVKSFRAALAELNITAPFYISQNDGTLMDADYVEKYPVLTFASGPTNSMRGAAYLTGRTEALVADIGGTTTDIGVLRNGFPRESSLTVDIGGVRTNFRMPDILAIGLGGGTIVSELDGDLAIGPESVGYKLISEAMVFGGGTLTTSDIAVAAGYADFGTWSNVAGLPGPTVEQGVRRIHEIVAEGVDRMKTSSEPIPLILVGGGSCLIDRDIDGASEVIVPENAGVANAIGASIAQVAGEFDSVVSYDSVGRESALEDAKKIAFSRAVEAGADESSLIVLDLEETPLAYAPDGAVRLRVKVAGDLAISKDKRNPS